MSGLKRCALPAMIALCAVLSACKPDPAVMAKMKAEAQQKAEREAEATAQLRFPRCLFLAANGAEVNIPTTLTESTEYKACIVEQAKSPMTNETFRAAIAKLYPMDKVEKSKNFHCSDWIAGEELCSTAGLSWGQDSSVSVNFSPKGEVTSISLTWSGHAAGNKLRELWGEPTATFDKASRLQYLYGPIAVTQPYFIGIGDGDTTVSASF